MSTKFGILTQNIDHEKLVDEDGDLLDYISRDIFEPIFFRGINTRWLSAVGVYLPDDMKVYALDNTQQGIFTIGDIKKFLNDETNS
jgi:hypothetical protein